MEPNQLLRIIAVAGKVMVGLAGLGFAVWVFGMSGAQDCLDAGSCTTSTGSYLSSAVLTLLAIGVAALGFKTKLWIAAPLYVLAGIVCMIAAAVAANAAQVDSTTWPLFLAAYLFVSAVGLVGATILTFLTRQEMRAA